MIKNESKQVSNVSIMLLLVLCKSEAYFLLYYDFAVCQSTPQAPRLTFLQVELYHLLGAD